MVYLISFVFSLGNITFVVVDLTSKPAFDCLDEWIQNYYKYSNPDSEKNVVLIGNKSDLVNRREVNEEDIEKFANNNNLMYFETSAKDGKNIDECFYFIAEKVLKQFENKDDKEEKDKNVINSDNLRNNGVVLIGDKKCCL